MYNFEDTGIIMGYSPVGIICPDYDVMKKYDTAARNSLAIVLLEMNGLTSSTSCLADTMSAMKTSRKFALS